MISKLWVIKSPGYDPYYNLALEKHLFDQVKADECILYLWQNQKTVVVGRNQLAGNECNIRLLQQEGGHLVRRMSGGGAVYHDLGNVNFTFLLSSRNFDEARQSEVILQALRKLGIDGEKNGRNDLTIDGRKFSGHAYYHHNHHSYHHGTIMLDVDKQQMGRYLSVSQLKLQDKHVQSVRSRVINLHQLKPDLTVGQLQDALISSFAEVYQGEVRPFPPERLDEDELARLQIHFASPQWVLDKEKKFACSKEKKYAWGILRIDYDLKDGVITDCAIYSDSLQVDYLSKVGRLIRKKKIDELDKALTEEKYQQINDDIIDLLKETEDQL